MTIGADAQILAAFRRVRRAQNVGGSRTFWTLGDFRCVLVRDAGRLSVLVFINEQPFLREPSKDSIEAPAQAEALFAVFSGANSTLQRS